MTQALQTLIEQTKREVPPTDRFALRRSFRKLPELLGEGEHFAHLAKGNFDGRVGLIAVTERRVIFVDEGRIYGGNSVAFPYETITAVETNTKLLHGAIAIHAASAIALFDQVFPKRRAEEVGAYIRDRLAGAHRSPSPAPVATAPSTEPDVIGQLKQLGELRDAGVLTQDEFDTKKAELLARI